MEDECPCPQEPCGLIDVKRVVASCPQHPSSRSQTIRNSHERGDAACMAMATARRAEREKSEELHL